MPDGMSNCRHGHQRSSSTVARRYMSCKLSGVTFRTIVSVFLLVQASHRTVSFTPSPKDAITRRNLSTAAKAKRKTLKPLSEVEKEDKDLPKWMKVIKEWPQREKAPPRPTRTTDDWLRAPLRDDEEAWLEEIVGPLNATETSTSNATSFLNPLINLINVETMISDAETEKAAQKSSLYDIKSPFDIPLRPNMDLSAIEELGGWNQWVDALRENVVANDQSFTKSAESVLKQATIRIEEIISDASSAVSPSSIQALINQARDLVVPTNLTMSDEATFFAANLVAVADRVIRKGYVSDVSLEDDESTALFSDFASCTELLGYSPYIQSIADMAAVAGSIYEVTLEKCFDVGHSVCAQGYSDNVFWMVTDCTMPSSAFADRGFQGSSVVSVRTITIRGFDASDEEVDRETLLNDVCAADPVQSEFAPNVLLHSGLYKVAQTIYDDIQQYIEWSAPNQKIALCGHSIGGSLCILILFLLTEEYGSDWVQDKIVRVYGYGNPPVASLRQNVPGDSCRILAEYGLTENLVHGFTQPWDPIVRLFTEIDALYPLAEDLGVDDMTPYADGPPRALRPITKKIFEAWEGWPRFRETFRGQSNQNYTSIGVVHILLPEPSRFLADRFVAVNIPVPQVETVLRMASRDHLAALGAIFPLDTFEISFVPQAIRSFVHHFYPAYDEPIMSLAKRRKGLASDE